MSLNKVKNYLAQFGVQNKVMEFQESSATVELAAIAVGVEPAKIAKTLSFKVNGEQRAILIVTAGDVKVDNAKFKHHFGFKAKNVVARRGFCPHRIQHWWCLSV